MAELKRVKISEELRDMIQRSYYEYQGNVSLMKSIITKNEEPMYNVEIYKEFKADYDRSHAEFNLILSEIVSLYAPEFDDSLQYKPSVLFNKCELVIEDTTHVCSRGGGHK